MEPWEPSTNMDGVSISESDRSSGSPKGGDMIAHGDTAGDRWLVNSLYFSQNYEPEVDVSEPKPPAAGRYET